MLLKLSRQLDQLENRVASDISTILTILKANRQTSLSFSSKNPKGHIVRQAALSESPTREDISEQGLLGQSTQAVHQMNLNMTSQPTDFSQVQCHFNLWIVNK